MKYAKLTKNGFEISEKEKPVCGPDQILVKTRYCGVCEGDVFGYRQGTGGENKPEKSVPGHEASGEIIEVGKNVTDLKPGDYITAIGGGFNEYFTTIPDMVVKVNNLETDPLGEPISCCVHAANRFGIELGDKVAMIGSGFMGLMCIQLAQLRGAASITVFDLIPWRLEYAKELGADITINPQEMTPEELDNLNESFDVVIEAAGTQSVVEMASKLVKQHGRIVFVGYHQSNEGIREVNMKLWNFKAIDIVNGHVRRMGEKSEAMQAGMNLVFNNKLAKDPLVTYYQFEDIDKAFKDLIDRKEGLFKASIVF